MPLPVDYEANAHVRAARRNGQTCGSQKLARRHLRAHPADGDGGAVGVFEAG